MYAIDTERIKELVYPASLSIPSESLLCLRGVIDIHCCMVPLVDMRLKFEITETRNDLETVILVVEVFGNYIGLVVDSACDVCSLDLGKDAESLSIVEHGMIQAVKGVGSYNGEPVIVLGIEQLFPKDELFAEILDLAEDMYGYEKTSTN